MRLMITQPLALISLSALWANTAFAAEHISTRNLTCEAAKKLVQTQGAVLLSTGPDLFDSYVRDRTFCTPSEQTIVNFIPTQDNKTCFVGYTCQEMTGMEEDH